MDVLANVLDLLRIQGYLYGRLELTAPFAYQFTGAAGICVIVIHGTTLLEVPGQETLVMTGGDLALLLEPSQYILRSDTTTPLSHIRTVTTPEEFHRTNFLSAGGGGIGVSVIAGGFRFSPGSEWLTKHLPRLMHISSSDPRSVPAFPSVPPLLQLIAGELAENQPGASTIVDRLAEVLFVQTIRTQIYSPHQTGERNWLRALADPQIGESLRLMHTDPGHRWTIPELARLVNMSRSAFATRFKSQVGKTPHHHLTEWRMIRAAMLMRDVRSLTVSEIACSIGYDSEAAFGKVFRRIIGTSPGKYRREDRTGR